MRGYVAALDVSDASTAICVLNRRGAAVLESSVSTTPTAIVAALKPYRAVLEVVGLETSNKATWLYKGLSKRKLPVVCLDAFQTHAALSALRNKTDKNDARGIAKILLRGAYHAVHVKSDDALKVRTLLGHRRALLQKAHDLRRAVRNAAKLLGIPIEEKSGCISLPARSPGRDPMMEKVIASMLRACAALNKEVDLLDELVAKIASSDPICGRLMTAPGVGPISALTFKAAVDDPSRFASSRLVGAYFGLTPRLLQSGQSSYSGRISKRGDAEVRTALFMSAMTMLLHSKKDCALLRWGRALKKRRGLKVAAAACARKLAVILHRMWVSERPFEFSAAKI